ncbi:MAG: crossover junction endodeoxyribonuclease RuvC [Acidobacteriia bacterium]|nr:crossover junction endodeoxyribonuclease RuvC [Terriglobia bacterium]
MRILGIDCGSERTGFGVIDSDGDLHQVVTFGAVETSSKQSFPRRLQKIHAGLASLIHQFSPDEVAVEEVFYASNVKSALKLGHVRGVALLAATEAGIPISEYSALEVKSSVVGYGRAEKRQVQEMVKVLLRLREIPQPDDAADALALSICHVHHRATQIRIEESLAAETKRHG